MLNISKFLILEKLLDRFSISYLKQLEDPLEIYAYIRSLNLRILGKGSSRITFLLSSKKVLKLAHNKKGVGQNEAEVEVYTMPKFKDFTTKIYDFDGQNYYWLISELVRPIKNEKEFLELTDIRFQDLIYLIEHNEELSPDDPTIFEVVPDLEKAKWVNNLNKFISESGLLYMDLTELEHWGKTPDGRVIILDYGYSEKVWEEFYLNKNNRKYSFTR